MQYSPNTQFLMGIKKGLSQTGIPVRFKLPSSDVPEPFFVVGNHFDDDSLSAKVGRAIVDTDLQIDLFYPIDSRTELEEIIFKTKQALGNRRGMTSDIRIDNSIGREVYHVIFNVKDFII